MRRFAVGLIAMMVVVTMVLVLSLAACGSVEETTTEQTAPAETTAAPTTSVVATTDEAPAATTESTQPPSGPTPAGDAGQADWQTVATLRSTDPDWQGLKDILVSEPFTVSGDAQLVLDMPEAGELDGVICAVIPADKATDPLTLVDAMWEGMVFTLVPIASIQEAAGLDGTYVLVSSVSGEVPWTVELQTRP